MSTMGAKMEGKGWILANASVIKDSWQSCVKMIKSVWLSPSLAVADATVEKIGAWMSGLWEGATSPAAQVQHA